MKLIQRTVIVVLALVALFFCASAVYAYRTNYVCAPGQHILQSDADAFEATKRLIATNRSFSSTDFGAQDTLDAIAETPNCCRVDRVVNSSLIIEWNVSVFVERRKKSFHLLTSLSNCGAPFHDKTFRMVDSIR